MITKNNLEGLKKQFYSKLRELPRGIKLDINIIYLGSQKLIWGSNNSTVLAEVKYD